MNDPAYFPSTRVIEKEKPRLGRLDGFVGFRMRRIQNQLSRNFAAATADRNLRAGLFSTLAIISANPGISQNEVGKIVGLDKSVVVQIVDDLESLGLAVRERSQVDRRRYALQPTEAGLKYLDELFNILAETENAVLKQLSPAELALLRELLDRMYAVYGSIDIVV
jgi:DNA-binding MarR family transcriptional regulator